MKILLANPSHKTSLDDKYEKYFIRSGSRWPHSGYKRKNTLPHYLPFPFYLAYAAALLKNAGFEVDVADCIALDMDEEAFLNYISKTAPDILFFESATPLISYDLSLIKKIKAIRDIFIILGGPHASVYSKDLMEENNDIDCVIRGEYERTLLETLEALDTGSGFLQIKGITYKTNGKMFENNDAPLIEPDSLLSPLRDYFPSPLKPDPALYWDGFCQKRPAIQMHATRGCPYKCGFCLWNQVMYKNGKYRVVSPLKVVDEMQDVAARYKAKEIYFDDDDFTVNKNNVKIICEEILKRKFKISWSCMGDAINPDKELIALMAKSGCIGMKFGVESASPGQIKQLGKPIDINRVRDIVGWCSRYKIKTHATFSLGLWGDDLRSIKETLDFMKTLNCDTIQVSLCTPFPGTEFFDKVKKSDCLLTTEWEKYDGKAFNVVSHPGLDMRQIDNLRQTAIKRWLLGRLSSPAWLWKQVYMLLRTFVGQGPVFFVKHAVSIISDERMLSKCAK